MSDRRSSNDYRSLALIVAAAMFLQQMDATVLAVALPTMARDFAVPELRLSMALTSYLLALAMFIPASGAVADRYGARRVFAGAIAIFVLGSLACSLAHSLEWLLVARFVQGVGGAMMMPVGRLVLLRNVSKDRIVDALAWLMVPGLIGPMVGPPIGGLLTTYLDWRWIFYINVPIGLLGIAGALRSFPDDPPGVVRRFDLPGFLLAATTLTGLVFGLETLSQPGRLATAAALLAMGLAAAIAYVGHGRRAAEPIVDLALLRVQTYRLSILGGLFTRIGQGAQPFLLSLLWQVAFGVSAVLSGTLAMASSLGAITMKVFAQRLLRRHGFRSIMIATGLLNSAGFLLCAAFRPYWPLWLMGTVLLLWGFVASLQYTAYNSIAFADVAHAKLSSATSLYATMQQVGLSLGVCTAALSVRAGNAVAGTQSLSIRVLSAALLLVGVLTTAAYHWNRQFAHDAGSDMT